MRSSCISLGAYCLGRDEALQVPNAKVAEARVKSYLGRMLSLNVVGTCSTFLIPAKTPNLILKPPSSRVAAAAPHLLPPPRNCTSAVFHKALAKHMSLPAFELIGKDQSPH